MKTAEICLTRRERQMIQGAIDGKTNKAIGFELGITENTIKVYFSRLFQKVGVSSRAELGNFGRSISFAGVRFENVAPSEFDALLAGIRTVAMTNLQRIKLMNALQDQITKGDV